MKDDDGPHLRLESAEAAVELIAIGDGRLVAGDRRGRDVDLVEFDIDAMAPDSARLIDAGADEDPVEPGVEAVGIPQRGQITPGPDERVLHGVLGQIGIPQDEPGSGIQPGDRGACQLGEGVMIASSRSLHEFLLHHAPRRWRGRSGRTHRVWRGDPPIPFHLRSGACPGPVARLPSTSPAVGRRAAPAEPPSREDPGSRRQIPAARPGPAGPGLGGRPHRRPRRARRPSGSSRRARAPS